MSIQTTYTSARANLAKLFNEVTQNREIVIIRRRGAEDVAKETAHLLRSPRNAKRLLEALGRTQLRTVSRRSGGCKSGRSNSSHARPNDASGAHRTGSGCVRSGNISFNSGGSGNGKPGCRDAG